MVVKKSEKFGGVIYGWSLMMMTTALRPELQCPRGGRRQMLLEHVLHRRPRTNVLRRLK